MATSSIHVCQYARKELDLEIGIVFTNQIRLGKVAIVQAQELISGLL